MTNDLNRNLHIDEKTFLVLLDINSRKNKKLKNVFIKAFSFMMLGFVAAFLVSSFIGGVVGNVLAAILSIASPILFITLLNRLSKKSDVLHEKNQKDEIAKQLNISPEQLRLEYKDLMIQRKPVPVTFLINGIIVVFGHICLLSLTIHNIIAFGSPNIMIMVTLVLIIILLLVLGVLFLVCNKKQRKRPVKGLRILANIILFI